MYTYICMYAYIYILHTHVSLGNNVVALTIESQIMLENYNTILNLCCSFNE